MNTIFLIRKIISSVIVVTYMFSSLFKKKSNGNANMGPKRKSLANISRNLQSGTSVARNAGGLGRRVHSLPSFIKYMNNHSHIIGGSNRPPNLHPMGNNSNRILYNTVQNNIKLSNLPPTISDKLKCPMLAGRLKGVTHLRGLNRRDLDQIKSCRRRIAEDLKIVNGDDHQYFFALQNDIKKIQNALYNLKV